MAKKQHPAMSCYRPLFCIIYGSSKETVTAFEVELVGTNNRLDYQQQSSWRMLLQMSILLETRSVSYKGAKNPTAVGMRLLSQEKFRLLLLFHGF